jgi:hypothetical protein
MCWEHPCGKCGGPPVPIEDYAKGKKQYLMIGDSVSILYFEPVNATLTNSTNIQAYHAPINCGPTRSGLSCITEWLGTAPDRWDAISYNFGMWNEGPTDCNLTKDASGHYLDQSLDQYITQLTNITNVLMQTRAGKAGHVIWVNTNPTSLVPECCTDVSPNKSIAPAQLGTHSCTKRIDVFNQAAKAMLAPMKPVVPIVDIYGWSVARCGSPYTWGYDCDIIPQLNCTSSCGTCPDGTCHDKKATCVSGQCTNCTNCDACQVHPTRFPGKGSSFMSGADYFSIPITAAVKRACG